MKYVRPDFYDSFKCKASDCRHSCCMGWEIDIDADTLELYSRIPGRIGRELKKNISNDGTPHFILKKDESCPFLRADGLCRLIAELGEEALCDICTEHPRFYNYVSDREEAGLGLCCEEAVRLLLERDGPLNFEIYTDDEECDADDTLIELRDRLFGILSDEGRTLYERMKMCMNILECELPEFDARGLAEVMMGLEILDPAWNEYLNALKMFCGDIKSALSGMKYQRLVQYFVYRHFACADADPRQNLYFAMVSTEIICALELCGFDLAETIRMYSAEIEYAEENTSAIKEKYMVSPK